MSTDAEARAEVFGRGPCLWCRRKLAPWQHNRPANTDEAEVEQARQLTVDSRHLSPPCSWCGRQLEAWQPPDPTQDPERAPEADSERSEALGQTRACRFCGGPISLEARRGRPPAYCSDDCRMEARRMRRRT